jgi:hypothetical protein
MEHVTINNDRPRDMTLGAVYYRYQFIRKLFFACWGDDNNFYRVGWRSLIKVLFVHTKPISLLGAKISHFYLIRLFQFKPIVGIFLWNCFCIRK